jgi:hypothetical protein
LEKNDPVPRFRLQQSKVVDDSIGTTRKQRILLKKVNTLRVLVEQKLQSGLNQVINTAPHHQKVNANKYFEVHKITDIIEPELVKKNEDFE